MEKLENFYAEFGLIIGFMIMTLIIQLTLGEKTERYWLLLILCGMILMNYEKFNEFLKDKFTLKKGE